MHKLHASISLADLSAAGVRLRPYEAVTLVRELVLQVTRGEIPGVPSAHVIRLSVPGVVAVEGPVAAGGGTVARAAQLLESLLPSGDVGGHFRVPGGLKLIVARALGQLDLPPFATLEAFAEALARFAATDASATIGNLIVTCGEYGASQPPAAAAEPPAETPQAQIEPFIAPRPQELQQRTATDPLTISDIRRARRATGLSLIEVARRSRIPIGLLRQLEWGYLANWPGGHYGRAHLIRYARGAGLDEQLVVSTVAPLLHEAERRRQELVHQPIVPASLTRIEPSIEVEVIPVLEAAPQEQARRRSPVWAGPAVAALFVIALLPLWWARSSKSASTIAEPGTSVTRTADTTVPIANPVEPPSKNGDAPPSAAPSPAPRDADAPADARPAARRIPKQSAETDASPAGATYRLAADGVTYSPSFANAGTAMFYHSDDKGKTALMRADTDSRGAVLQITSIVDDGAKNFHVRPSPDGSRIAFDSDRDGRRAVYIADADGKNVRRVSPEASWFAAVPSWSYDGTRLAFVQAEESRPKVWNLWIVELDKGTLHQVTRHRVGQPWGGSWFPDNVRIAYSHERRLVVRDLRDGSERVFQSPRPGGWVRTPAVSPDGRRIVFQVHGDGAWLLELKDGSMRRILEDPTAEEYTWAPDGKRVAYHSRKSGVWGVWVMAPR